MTTRHFLVDNDITPDEQNLVLKVAQVIAADRQKVADALKGAGIGLLFEKPSLRTRVSSERACHFLGAEPIILRGDELHLKRGETPADCIKVLAGYLNLFMARVFDHAFLEQVAEPCLIPVVNGLSDRFHPLQALADLLTLQQLWGPFSAKTVTYLGDGNNVCSSLAIAGAMAGLHIIASCPPEYTLPPDVLEIARTIAKQTGGAVEVIENPQQAVAHADALYTDVWLSMGASEAGRLERYAKLKPYQINNALLAQAPKHCSVLHCLPAHRGEEITSDVLDSKQSVVVRQAHNRLPTAAALFLFLLRPEVCRALI